MSKKIVELKSKKKIELREMSIDEVDFCNDLAVMQYENGEVSHISGLSKTRTAWLDDVLRVETLKHLKLVQMDIQRIRF